MATTNNIEYVGINTLTRMSTNIQATYALKTVFGAASASANGSAGLVPAPTAGNQSKFLRADGTWATPTNTTYTLSSFGITATAAELNILDGATIDVTELNYLDGVTANIQTQLDGKAASSHGTHVTYSTTVPVVAGTASAGTAATVSRSDHVHPAQTSVSGNAGTATKLATARKLTIGSTGKDFDGSAALTWTLAEIGAAAASHTHDYAASSHSHAISDITNLQTTLDGKAAASHGTHVTFSTTVPVVAGTASVGSATTVSRSDHVHPAQTSVSGNAGTATKLATARTLTIGSSGKSFDGSANVSWTLAEIGAAATDHGTHVTFSTTAPVVAGTAAVGTATTVSRSDHVHPAQTTVSGNAGSATKLATARTLTIGSSGKSFNGTANVSWTLAEIGAAEASHTHSEYLEAAGVAIAVDDSAVIAAVTAAASA